MKLETRSVPVVLENDGRQSWTPYRIGERPDHQVRVTPGFTTPVKDFTQEVFVLPLPFPEDPVLLTQIATDQYKVGDIGELQIFTTRCTYIINISKEKKIIFSAPIPLGKKDVICTGLAVVGATMHKAGFNP
ncbi:MAG: hypothetical protein NTY06_04520 [Candidatus Gottesmanbacteria bacterium]|nr:hypothetical protein [Candidatus Gottesmanbacteria bacterium]